ncbi:probable leupeptin-inactivating enzyme 1 precursor [Ramularia collo-cygni]|uniref:Peptide hydrolase n=1 Tax=Ramularia collo-cygni TaxID=112498 RepID=A0A2D3V1D3_9PEZI|nr:probable leupeptin-inactivating enzyme 1 precursor [Ramularia collo-cygni]CZT19290.1 probable leupeptin-inactivating enzyme 1 precursor [Ramularia collo-cygni]
MGGFKGIIAAALLGSVAAHVVQQPLVDSEAKGLGKPLVDSKKLESSIDGKTLSARAEDLYKLAELSWHEYNRPTRVIGSAGHKATLEYIWSQLAQLGDYYTLSDQSFPAFSGSVYESRLVIGSDVIQNASAMSLTPPTKDKEPVHGDLILVNESGCSASDYPPSVKGNIAFIQRGTCSFGDKSANSGRAGAIAAVVYNTESGPLHGTMGTPSEDHVATFGISREEAESYLKELKKGKHVDAIAYIDAFVSTIVSSNIVAQTAEGDPENCVMLGAHSDSVPEGPGINDDGSGTLSLLEVAKQLTKYSVNNCVRFAWWAAEEEGLVGSDFYAASLSPEENKKVRLFMDYDMMGSPNFAYQIYNATNEDSPVGSEELRDLYVDWYEAKGLNYTFIPFDGRSDYDGFIRAGIPAGGIATGAEGIKTKKEAEMFGGKAGDWYDPCYHQLCDDVGNVNVTAWVVNTQLIAHSVATYARSFDGFPNRTDAKAAGVSLYEQNTKHHGSALYI